MTGLHVDPSIPRYTRGQLVADLEQRFAVTDALLRDWQNKGLMAAPRMEGRWEPGQPGSHPGLWSENDRLMVISALELRDRVARENGWKRALPGIAQYIVWSWAYWDGYVQLDQAQRATQTWVLPQLGGVGKGRAKSRTRVDRYVRMNVDQLAAPGVLLQTRKRVAARIAERIWFSDLAGLAALADDLGAVIDPQRAGRRVGAPGVSVSPGGELDRIYVSHLGAEAVVAKNPELTESDWEEARGALRSTWVSYTAEQPRLAANANTPGFFGKPNLQYQFDRCAPSLVLVLGAMLANRQDGTSAPARFR
jgi:hypothetical protein